MDYSPNNAAKEPSHVKVVDESAQTKPPPKAAVSKILLPESSAEDIDLPEAVVNTSRPKSSARSNTSSRIMSLRNPTLNMLGSSRLSNDGKEKEKEKEKEQEKSAEKEPEQPAQSSNKENEDAAKLDTKKTEEQLAQLHKKDLNRIPMFIPWEKPVLGKEADVSKAGEAGAGETAGAETKRTKRRNGPPNLDRLMKKSRSHKKKRQQDEASAAADENPAPMDTDEQSQKTARPQPLKRGARLPALSPLKRLPPTKVMAHDSTLSAIQRDRQRQQAIRNISNQLANELQFGNVVADLIMKYAELELDTFDFKIVRQKPVAFVV